jgi:hypothetical protein
VIASDQLSKLVERAQRGKTQADPIVPMDDDSTIRAVSVPAEGVPAEGIRAEGIRAEGVRAEGVRAEGSGRLAPTPPIIPAGAETERIPKQYSYPMAPSSTHRTTIVALVLALVAAAGVVGGAILLR